MSRTKDPIVQHIYESKPVIALYHYAMTVGFWPDFPDHQLESIAKFLEIVEITDINKIDELLTKHENTLRRYIAHIYANRKNPWRVTPIFLCELALIAKFVNSFTVENLVENGWDEDISRIIILAAEKFSPELA